MSFTFRFLKNTAATFAATALILGTPIRAEESNKGVFTLYYIAEVKAEAVSSGGVQVKSRTGEQKRFRLSSSDLKKANIEGTAFTRGTDGEMVVANFIRPGMWFVLPPGWKGKGNKMNPIHPYRTVAADQGVHSYGSMIYISDADGFQLPDGTTHDGIFWVADIGGRIKGRFRFDIFVGEEPNYETLRQSGIGKWEGAVKVHEIPEPPAGLDYRHRHGRKKILEKLGYDVEGPLENLIEELTGIDDAGSSAEAALIHFQKQHPAIPSLEYGRGDSAITRWYLAQAAQAISRGEAYPGGPS